MLLLMVLVLGMETMPKQWSLNAKDRPQKSELRSAESESESETEVGTFSLALGRN